MSEINERVPELVGKTIAEASLTDEYGSGFEIRFTDGTWCQVVGSSYEEAYAILDWGDDIEARKREADERKAAEEARQATLPVYDGPLVHGVDLYRLTRRGSDGEYNLASVQARLGCDAREDWIAGAVCELPASHKGSHRSGITAWDHWAGMLSTGDLITSVVSRVSPKDITIGGAA